MSSKGLAPKKKKNRTNIYGILFRELYYIIKIHACFPLFMLNNWRSRTIHTWKMAYMMQVRGRLLEYSDTLKIFRPHLFRSSSSLDSSSSLPVLTPKREMLLLESEGPWETFFTPLICVISCCFCCFFFSLVLDVGDGISTSFCLSAQRQNVKKKTSKWVFIGLSVISY